MAVTVNRGRAVLHAFSILGDHSVELLSTQSQPIALVFYLSANSSSSRFPPHSSLFPSLDDAPTRSTYAIVESIRRRQLMTGDELW